VTTGGVDAMKDIESSPRRLAGGAAFDRVFESVRFLVDPESTFFFNRFQARESFLREVSE
jgi:hypothetical protein